LAFTGLDNQGGSGRQKTGCLGNQHPIGVEPVGAAIQRRARVIFPDLHGQIGVGLLRGNSPR